MTYEPTTSENYRRITIYSVLAYFFFVAAIISTIAIISLSFKAVNPKGLLLFGGMELFAELAAGLIFFGFHSNKKKFGTIGNLFAICAIIFEILMVIAMIKQ